MKSLFAIGGLMLAALILSTGAASACTQQCVAVSGTICHQCVDVGYFTGITCIPSSSCFCQRTPNTCGQAASGIQAQTALATMAAPAGKGAVCAAPAAEDVLPDVLLR